MRVSPFLASFMRGIQVPYIYMCVCVCVCVCGGPTVPSWGFTMGGGMTAKGGGEGESLEATMGLVSYTLYSIAYIR